MHLLEQGKGICYTVKAAFDLKKAHCKTLLPLLSSLHPALSQAPLAALCRLGALALKVHVSRIARWL